MTSSPGLAVYRPAVVLQTPTDDDRHQRRYYSLAPYTMCRRASKIYVIQQASRHVQATIVFC